MSFILLVFHLRLTCEEERQAGEQTCGEVREMKIKKLVSPFEGLDPGGAHFPEHQGGRTDDQTLSSALKKHTVKSFKCANYLI